MLQLALNAPNPKAVYIAIPMLICFFALMLGVGFACRRSAKSVDSFVFGVGLELVQLLIGMKIITVSGPVLSFVFTNSLYSGVFAMVGGLILMPIVSAFTKKFPLEVEQNFSCYNN